MAVGKYGLSRVSDLLPAEQLHTHLTQFVRSLSILQFIILASLFIGIMLVWEILLRLGVICHAVFREDILANLSPYCLISQTFVLMSLRRQTLLQGSLSLGLLHTT